MTMKPVCDGPKCPNKGTPIRSDLMFAACKVSENETLHFGRCCADVPEAWAACTELHMAKIGESMALLREALRTKSEAPK